VRSPLWRTVPWALGLAVIGFAGWQVAANWATVRAARVELAFEPWPLLGALGCVWLGFAALIVAWRATVRAAGGTLSPRGAAHIWLVSSLGKYLPGKVWAIAGLMVMARERGVSGSAAAAAAIFQQLVSIGAGAVLVFLAGREQLVDLLPGGRVAFVVLLIGAVVALGMPLSSRVMGFVGAALERIGTSGVGAREGSAPLVLPVSVLLTSVVANAVAWSAYAVAVMLLAHGLLPGLAGELSFARALGGFTAAYIAGVLAVLAPGGLGVREGLLVLLLAPAIGEGGAVVLALATRVLFTLAEFGAAAPLVLAAKEKPRVV